MEKIERKTPIKSIIIAVLFVGALVFVSVKYAPSIINTVKNLDNFRAYLLSFGNLGVLVLAFFQFLHILIPVIPGEFVQMAGGYVYGTIIGSIILLISTIIGTVIVFYLSRIIGYPVVKIFVSKEKMEKFAFLSNSNKIEVAMFILFLIPGLPKDALIYIAGLTPINPSRFILISTIARAPGVIGAAFIGANILEKDYKSAIIMGSISVIALTLGIIFRKKILSHLNHKS